MAIGIGLIVVISFVGGYSASAIKRWIDSRAAINEAKAEAIRSGSVTVPN